MNVQKKEEKKDDVVIDALRELTKVVTDVSKELKELKGEWEKWRKAGRF